MNMSLATIDTKEKSDDITALLRKEIINVNPLWIGAVANGEDRHYVWISNGHTVTFTNWFQGEPNFYAKSEYCLQTGFSENLQWNDDRCHRSFGLICDYGQNMDIRNKLQQLEDKTKNLQEELQDNETKLQAELVKKAQLQKDLDISQEKYQEQLAKEQQLQEDLDKNNEELQDKLIKEQDLQDGLNKTQSLVKWLLNMKKPDSSFNEDKRISNIFVNIN